MRIANKKTGNAKYTFKLAADLQDFADEKHVYITSFQTRPTYNREGKNFDLLSVKILVPRPDRDEEQEEAPTIIEQPCEDVSGEKEESL